MAHWWNRLTYAGSMKPEEKPLEKAKPPARDKPAEKKLVLRFKRSVNQ